MFKMWKARKEAALLAKIRADDADVGANPTPATLHTRVTKAAYDNMWTVVEDSLQKGASCDDKVHVHLAKQIKPLDLAVGHRLATCDVPLLGMAIVHGNLEAAKKLVAAGCDINALIKSDCTANRSPLYAAVALGRADIVQLLCDNGVDLSDDTPLQLAETKGFRDINKIIRAETAKRASPVVEDATLEDRRKIMAAVSSLPVEGREKLMASLRDAFPAPYAAAAPAATPGLGQDMQILRPLSLKKSGVQQQ
ncbi:MAG: ankyrin repeat domain-containing protein [Alphaproteobacteria bacterium]